MAATRPYVSIDGMDRSAILDLISAYAFLYDDDQLVALGALFTDDAVLHPNFGPAFPARVEGRESLVAFYEIGRGECRRHAIQPRHYSANPLFTAASETCAELSVNMLYTEYSNGTALVKYIGRYEFNVVKEGGNWFIAALSWRYDPQE